MLRNSTVLLAAMSVMGLAANAGASLAVYEGFDYEVGPLAGKGGGTGFVAGSTYTTTGDTVAVAADSLSYTGLLSGTGNQLGMAANQNIGAGRGWGTNSTPAGGSVFWYSFLVKPTNGSRGTFVPFSGTSANSNGQNGFGLRMGRGSDNTTVIFKTWSPGQWDGSSTGNPNTIEVANGYGLTYLVVGRLSMSENGAQTTSTLWVNPALGVEPSTGGISLTVNTASHPFATRLSGRQFSGAAEAITYYDELRIGATAMDVMPVPEPMTIAALGLGVAALLRRPRRRS